MISFFVDGIPKGQPRPRAFARKMGDGKFVARVYDAGTAEAWKSQVAWAAKAFVPRVPLEGPVIVNLAFRFPRPKSLCRAKGPAGEIPHTSKPDADNLAKAVLDCMTALGFWRGDEVVATLVVSKVYCAKNSSASGVGVEIIAAELEARRAS